MALLNSQAKDFELVSLGKMANEDKRMEFPSSCPGLSHISHSLLNTQIIQCFPLCTILRECDLIDRAVVTRSYGLEFDIPTVYNI